MLTSVARPPCTPWVLPALAPSARRSLRLTATLARSGLELARDAVGAGGRMDPAGWRGSAAHSAAWRPGRTRAQAARVGGIRWCEGWVSPTMLRAPSRARGAGGGGQPADTLQCDRAWSRFRAEAFIPGRSRRTTCEMRRPLVGSRSFQRRPPPAERSSLTPPPGLSGGGSPTSPSRVIYYTQRSIYTQ